MLTLRVIVGEVFESKSLHFLSIHLQYMTSVTYSTVIITSPYAAKAAASLLLFHIRHSDVCGIRWYILRHHSLQW